MKLSPQLLVPLGGIVAVQASNYVSYAGEQTVLDVKSGRVKLNQFENHWNVPGMHTCFLPNEYLIDCCRV
jgi:hypothetical protein